MVLRRCVFVTAVVFLSGSASALSASAEPLFESGPSRPLALSPDGSRLFAVNTPDHRLEIFDVTSSGLRPYASVPVGLEPIAVAVRTASEVWVVNHLSDSVSVVDVASVPPRVRRTLLVGDEPGDVVFAGPNRRRAFITAARRGQNLPFDPQFFTPGIGRADVWVFDAENLGAAHGGQPMTIVHGFGDAARALAVSPDGRTVYAAVFRSGNRTTVISEGAIPAGALPPPTASADGVPAPATSLIVKYDGTHWRDAAGRAWDDAVRFSLPDKDVFAIDAFADPPREVRSWSGVGTVLYGMAVNPVSGKVYVTNTEARNDVRFEGPGTYAGSTVRGHVVDNRVTRLDPDGARPIDLNAHIGRDAAPGPPLERARSIAQPGAIAFTADGATMFVAAFGSGKIQRISLSELDGGTFRPSLGSAITIAGGGPSGIVLDESRGVVHVMSRFDNAIMTVRLADRATVSRARLHHREPESVVRGRKIFYDAKASSAHGDASCASCHVFGDTDDLSWDLGNPEGKPTPNPNPFRFPERLDAPDFHPMKGPMATQTLRSLPSHGPLHWRGDRTGANDPGGRSTDTRAGLMQFAGAFDSLLGRGAPLDAATMGSLADFILSLKAPPNPVRALDNSLNAAQARGRSVYHTTTTSGAGTCASCHRLDPTIGQFGTDGMSSFDGFSQLFKIPTLRSAYSKVGMFGMTESALFRSGDNGFMGDQIRGFGYSFDGSVDTLLRFQRARVFNFPGGEGQRRDVAEFLLAFDSDFAPIVGQQVTRTAANAFGADSRIDLLLARAAVSECDVVVHGNVRGAARGWVRLASGLFRPDRAGEVPIPERDLRAIATTPGQELTYTAVPFGAGVRLGVDRDGDGWLDGDESDASSDPADPLRIPSDRDGDGAANGSDCAPDDPGAFAVPAEVGGLRLVHDRKSTLTTLTWSSASGAAGPATTSDVATGVLGELRADRGFARSVCLASGDGDDRTDDARGNPSPRQGYWYLVRARNACAAGTYGSGAGSAPRSIAACP